MLFAKDPAATDMFKSVPNINSGDDKEEKNLYIIRFVVFYSQFTKEKRIQWSVDLTEELNCWNML